MVGGRTSRRLVFFGFLLLLVAVDVGADITRPGCPDKCGDVSIPYPFGFGTDKSCYFDEGFHLACNTTFTPARPFQGVLEVFNISLVWGQLRAAYTIVHNCDYALRQDVTSAWINLRGSPFNFSGTSNKFTALGCDTQAFIQGSGGVSYTSGCISYCTSELGMKNGRCSGEGCCQTPIHSWMRMFNISINSFNKHAYSWGGNPCSYAFVAAEDGYEFQVSDLSDKDFGKRRLPLVLDWSIGNETCAQVEHNRGNECHSGNSKCVDAPRGVGYLCNCTEGYQGNPYLKDPDGCQDINECDHPEIYPCDGWCRNRKGSYKCLSRGLMLGIGLGIGLFFLLLGSFFALWWLHRRKLRKVKQQLFERNGGEHVKRHLSAYGGGTFRVYPIEELERATNKFNAGSIIEEGSQATVYKGSLDDRALAIKKFKNFDDKRSEEFVKEMITVSQINHKNVVRLLGCCLEVSLPMLVFEFIPGGNLGEFLHGGPSRVPISLDTRLSIAADVAEALTYLHSYASTPIFHGDIKSANILLEENHVAKITDFTASRLAAKDRAQVATVVQGTCGYLDPVYLRTCQLTEKSDVYSFGVVLVELLTRKVPIQFEGPGEQRSLVSQFVSSVAQNRPRLMLDGEIVTQGDMERLRTVAELACDCIKMNQEERPTMKEVMMALTTVRKVPRAPAGSRLT